MGAQVVFLLLLSFPGCQLPSSEEMAEAGDHGDRCFRLEESKGGCGKVPSEWAFQGQDLLELLPIVALHLSGPRKRSLRMS